MSEKENFEKFIKDREEIKNNVLDFYNKKIENEFFRLAINNALPELGEKDFKYLVEQKNGHPLVMAQGNDITLYNALYMLINTTGDFYKAIRALLALKEIELSCGPWYDSSFKHETKTPEEGELLKELFQKSPEEIEKIKEQLKNNEQ